MGTAAGAVVACACWLTDVGIAAVVLGAVFAVGFLRHRRAQRARLDHPPGDLSPRS